MLVLVAAAGLKATGLYGVALAACILAICWRPAIGLYFIVPLLPLQTTRYRLHELPFGANIIDIVLLSTIIGAWLKGYSFVPSKLNRLLIVFGLFCYLSLWRGVFFLDSALPISFREPRFNDWKNYMLMPLLFFVVLMVIRELKEMKWLIAMMCGSAVYVCWGFYKTVSGRDLSHFSYSVRDAGPLGYAGENGLAAFEVELSAFLLALIFCKSLPRSVRVGLCAVLACNIYCICFAFSRGGYLATLAILLFFGLFKVRKLLLVAILLAVSWQLFIPVAVQERIEMTYQENPGELDASAAERINLWDDAMTLIKNNPVFGTGFDTYAFMGRVGAFRDTHNYYVKVLLETGAVGLMLFLYLLWSFFYTGWSLHRAAEDPFLSALGFGYAALVFAAVIVNAFGDRWMFMQVNGYTWVLLACVVRGHLLWKEQSQKLSEPAVPVPILVPETIQSTP